MTVSLFVLGFLAQAGYYRPVAPQPQKGPPCGHYGTKPCEEKPANIQIPAGATADQLFESCLKAYAQKQYPVAAAYCQPAADKGHTRAQASLGLMFFHGHGEPKDMAKAISFLTLAADKGHRVAQGQLGDIYEDGDDGIPQNLTKAFHYHLLSANQRWWQGELRAGIDYELGYGTPRSRQTALVYLDRATADGKDGFSQQLASMLRRSDTPARFRDMDHMSAHFSGLVGQAYQNSLPKFPAGKNCREHYAPGRINPQRNYWCD